MTRLIVQAQRKSGKTNLAVYEFMKDPMNSVLFVNNQVSYSYVVGIIADRYKVDADDMMRIRRRIKGSRDTFKWDLPNMKNVIFDEMLYFSDYNGLFNQAMAYTNNPNIYIFSSIPPKWNLAKKQSRKEQKAFIKALTKKSGFRLVKMKAIEPKRQLHQPVRAEISAAVDKMKASTYEVSALAHSSCATSDPSFSRPTTTIISGKKVPFTYTQLTIPFEEYKND